MSLHTENTSATASQTACLQLCSPGAGSTPFTAASSPVDVTWLPKSVKVIKGPSGRLKACVLSSSSQPAAS